MEQELRDKHGAGKNLLLQESMNELARLTYTRTDLGKSYDSRYFLEQERIKLQRDASLHESFAYPDLSQIQSVQQLLEKQKRRTKWIAAELSESKREHAAHSTLVPSSSLAPTEIRRKAQEEVLGS